MSKKLIAVVIGALVVSVTAISPALGGPSLQQMVEDEVAKVSKKKKKGPRGPAGPAGAKGASGAPGAPGADGTARAYARVDNPCATGNQCTFDRSKGISGARESSTAGQYCITATGIDPNTTPHLAVVDVGDTGAGAGEEQAMPNSNGAACNAGEFQVQTTRDGSNVTDIAFYILIP